MLKDVSYRRYPTMSTVKICIIMLTYSVCCQAAVTKTLKIGVIKSSAMFWGDNKGFLPDVVRELANKTGYSLPMQNVGDNRYGSYDEKTKKWSGLVGELVDKKVDMIAADLTVTSQRYGAIDYTFEVWDMATVLLVRAPDDIAALNRYASFFFGAFSGSVWLSLIALFIATVAIIYFNSRLNPREWKLRASRGEEVRNNLAEAIFYLFNITFYQGYPTTPYSICGRMMTAVWSIFSTIFLVTYVAAMICAIVASSGTIKKPLEISSLSDAAVKANYGYLKPLLLKYGSTYHMFKNSKDPKMKAIFKAFEDNTDKRTNNMKSISEIISYLKEVDDYMAVAFVDSAMADYHVKNSSCKVMVVGSAIAERSIAFAFRHGENIEERKTINQEIVRMRYDGRMDEIYDKYLGRDDCLGLTTATQRESSLVAEEITKVFQQSLPIGMATFIGPLCLYLIGLLLSGIGLFSDIYIYTRFERNTQGMQNVRNRDNSLNESRLELEEDA